jgi:hypothetical protein
MNADTLLSHLDGVKRTGTNRWLAKCPAHDDRKASLAIRELDDGRILLHDFAGCEPEHVLSAVGLSFNDLFPERAIGENLPKERRPFPAADVLRAIRFEALVVVCAAKMLANGEALTEADRERLNAASARIGAALEASGHA